MRSLGLLSVAVAGVLGLASSANATAIHRSFVGTNYTFGTPGVSGPLVQETSNAGDPEPLLGAPVVVGNSLLFSPPAFTAQSGFGAGFADAGSQLQFELIGNSATPSCGFGPESLVAVAGLLWLYRRRLNRA